MPAEALPVAAEHADREAVVGVEAVQRGGDRLGQRAVDRVADLGAVEHADEDRAALLDEQRLLRGHAGTPSSAAPRRSRGATR
jgi:hypothetical protein